MSMNPHKDRGNQGFGVRIRKKILLKIGKGDVDGENFGRRG